MSQSSGVTIMGWPPAIPRNAFVSMPATSPIDLTTDAVANKMPPRRSPLPPRRRQAWEPELLDLTTEEDDAEEDDVVITAASAVPKYRHPRGSRRLQTNRQANSGTATAQDHLGARLVHANPNQASVRHSPDQLAYEVLPRLLPLALRPVQQPGTDIWHRHPYRPGMDVELRNGTFLRITSLHTDYAGQAYIRGWWLVRQSGQRPMMPERASELVWVCKATSAAPQAAHRGSCESFPVAVVRHPCRIVFTNRSFPRKGPPTLADDRLNAAENGGTGLFFCRWKQTVIRDSKDVHHDSQNVQVASGVLGQEGSIERLGYDEADNMTIYEDGHPVRSKTSSTRIRDMWRGHGTVPGQPYKFGDTFCGTGGASSGARAAGLHVEYGVDMDPAAVRTYRLNFEAQGTSCYQEGVDQFINRFDMDAYRVDVLHMSPPCQAFSPAKTVMTPDRDEANQAALFSAGPLLSTVKARIVTMEETFGLLTRHFQWFAALINVFIECGYGVRWKLLDCADYGVSQSRKRLWLIAAGPGEKLPQYAKPTHGNGPGLERTPTIFETICDIPADATHHNPAERLAQGFQNGDRPAYDAWTLAKTLTTNAGEANYHPDGERHYTIREIACLQSFPLTHWWGGENLTTMKRQIGNAVPPRMAETLYREIIKSLQETDAREAGRIV